METSLQKVRHILLVLSGKGGVGKSSVTTQLALSLAAKGFKVGVLDIDLTGPSIPRMFSSESSKVYQSAQNGWIPVQISENLTIMSLGFLINDRNNSIVWRGAKKTAMIQQFMKDVYWGVLDYLIIDTPPGTSDEHIAIATELQFAKPDGAIIVTTPQGVAIADVKKEINYCEKVGFNVLGIVENMSGFICPHCDECTNIFSSGGGENLSKELGIEFLGNVPIDPTFVELIEKEKSDKGELLELYKESSLAVIFGGIVDKIIERDLPSRI